jgi:hypothetical protein
MHCVIMSVAEREFRKRRGEHTAPYLPKWELLLATVLITLQLAFSLRILAYSTEDHEQNQVQVTQP